MLTLAASNVKFQSLLPPCTLRRSSSAARRRFPPSWRPETRRKTRVKNTQLVSFTKKGFLPNIPEKISNNAKLI